ncbi:hypothetical protein NC653_025853 [Populus alba x Populus x berolinensis]|uniref:Uncharacterized protein n=1 Tax=Populus alba x Populus x berolinensis TaxID=444605 RepID=A0AAD6MEJ9_9ROSI|nr:hypothetical protein NC653_025853 [Populus alba x Populus x berolinensis]
MRTPASMEALAMQLFCSFLGKREKHCCLIRLHCLFGSPDADEIFCTPSELMLGATYGLIYPGLGYACLRGRCRQKQKVTCLDGLMRTMLSAFTSVLSPFPWHLRV